MAKTGAASQEIAQYINALIKENENKTAWISSLVREYQEKTHILRQHELGLHVHAEVIKRVTSQQSQQRETPGTVPTVTELDEGNETGQDFQNGQSPHTRPPDTSSFGVVNHVPQVPTSIQIVQMF